jgi:hypothetical protein
LIVLAFFLLTWYAQYATLAKYLPYIPEKIRGLIQAVFLTIFAVNSGFYLSLIPLGMVFIFCWLYLNNVQVDLRKLYQIAVLSILPFFLLMLGSLIYTLLFMKVEPSVSQRLTEVFSAVLDNPQQTASDPTIRAKMDELIKARQQQSETMKYLEIAATTLSCLLCGYLLYARLKLAAWKAWLIPATFAVSIGLVRTIAAGGSGQLMDRLKTIMQP